jgi:hypothetical protein
LSVRLDPDTHANLARVLAVKGWSVRQVIKACCKDWEQRFVLPMLSPADRELYFKHQLSPARFKDIRELVHGDPTAETEVFSDATANAGDAA